jgi:hypothetical protein
MLYKLFKNINGKDFLMKDIRNETTLTLESRPIVKKSLDAGLVNGC